MGGIPHAGSQQTWNSFTAPQNSPAFSFCNDKLPYSCVVLCLVTQLCPTLLDPTDCSPPRILCPRGFSRQEYWNGFSCPPKGDLSNLELKLRFPSLQADSLPAELPGKHPPPIPNSFQKLRKYINSEFDMKLSKGFLWVWMYFE